ncbi:hypothetical protein V1L54_21385 [Streptomyces sp. TRM 70361]|uniref:hypothetical protein n=1 Tax=Streptomyces sp. TRM 70361 TaxID=3116553 RepID=UPI002E7BD1B6|nr:hypothetical protein [Streptomyces sp. TRM 70361]MEE1941927.1 hypothetical protein [Streptomyces sp. TRM 70361]
MSSPSSGALDAARPAVRPGVAGPLRRLRGLLALDAAATGVNALAYLALAGPLGRLLGVGTGLLAGLGAFLLLYGAAVGLLASRPVPPALGVRAVVEANALWALASGAVLALGLLEPTAAGLVWIPLQAVVVAVLAVAQHLALRAVLRSGGR